MNAVVYDLDNTLYDSKQYYLGAFDNVAEYISSKYPFTRQHVFDLLRMNWEMHTSLYPHLFDDLQNCLGITEDVNNLVTVFNGYGGKLTPYQGAVTTLQTLRKWNYKLGLITDGDIERQKRKLKLLKIIDLFDAIVYTRQLSSPKPSDIPFRYMVAKLKISPKISFYVADNPLVDFEGAKKTGFITIRVSTGEFRNIKKNAYVDYEVQTLKEILSIVKNV
jgi:putative hydrolase of the HAD superfamily